MFDLSLLLFFVLCACYIIPWVVAGARKHQNAMAIGILNLLLGWTLIGWVAALVWSCTAVTPLPSSVLTTGGRS